MNINCSKSDINPLKLVVLTSSQRLMFNYFKWFFFTVQKKLKLGSLENEDELEEIADLLAVSAMPSAVTELGKKKKSKKADHIPLKKEEQPMQSQQPMEMRAGGDDEATVKPSPQMDNAESMEIPLEEAAESNSGEGAMAAENHLLESKTTKDELVSVENTTPKKDQKEPCEDTVPDCNEDKETGITQVKHNMAEATTVATGMPFTTLPSHSSHHKLNDDVVVTDGKEDDKEKEADSKKDEEKVTGKEGNDTVHILIRCSLCTVHYVVV